MGRKIINVLYFIYLINIFSPTRQKYSPENPSIDQQNKSTHLSPLRIFLSQSVSSIR